MYSSMEPAVALVAIVSTCLSVVFHLLGDYAGSRCQRSGREDLLTRQPGRLSRKDLERDAFGRPLVALLVHEIPPVVGGTSRDRSDSHLRSLLSMGA